MIKNNFGRIVNCSSIGIKFGRGAIHITIVYQNLPPNLSLIIFKDWAKNVLINNLRIGVTNTKLHKKIGKK